MKCLRSSAGYLDAQRQYVGIAHRPLPQPARHAATVVATAMAAMVHPTPSREAAGLAIAAAVVVVGPAAVQGRDGRERVLPCYTR